jgi:hypothetical protein
MSDMISPVYPELIACHDLVSLCRHIHGNDNDWVDGDLFARLTTFAQYLLAPVPLANLNLTAHLEPDVVSIYVERLRRGETLPPFVCDLQTGDIIDGNHRVAALVAAGITVATAYVTIHA